MEGIDLVRAIDLAQRALRSDPEPRTAARIHVILSEAHRWRGELAHARTAARAAMDLAVEDTGPWYEAVSQLAYASIFDR